MSDYKKGISVSARALLNAVLLAGFSPDQKNFLKGIGGKAGYIYGLTGGVVSYLNTLSEGMISYIMIFLVVMLLVLVVTVLLLLRNVKLSKELKEAAHYDALTGIYNRGFFMEISSLQIARSLRTYTNCFITIFDLDRFKVVNDTYGHLAGDKVLIEITKRVKKIIRPYDTFGRFGGEEFIIFMCDVSKIDKEKVIGITERIRQEICNTPVEYDNKQISVSASFGIAYAPPINDLQTAIKYADIALYRAKENGRNRVAFYDQEILAGADPKITEPVSESVLAIDRRE